MWDSWLRKVIVAVIVLFIAVVLMVIIVIMITIKINTKPVVVKLTRKAKHVSTNEAGK